MFTGYDPLRYKLAIWTLSAVMCGIAGALYVPQVGIINPSEMSPAASIEIAIWAAVGGRGTLIGPIVGAFFVNGAKSWFTQAFPEFWLYLLGALFIAVTLFLPQRHRRPVPARRCWRCAAQRAQGRGTRMTPDLMQAGARARRDAEQRGDRARRRHVRRPRGELRAASASRASSTSRTAPSSTSTTSPSASTASRR